MATVSQAFVGRESSSKTEYGVIRFRIPADFYKRVRIEAIERKTNVQQLCNAALKHYLDNVIDS